MKMHVAATEAESATSIALQLRLPFISLCCIAIAILIVEIVSAFWPMQTACSGII